MAVDEVDPFAELKADLAHADEIASVKLQNAALITEATEIYQKVINLGATREQTSSDLNQPSVLAVQRTFRRLLSDSRRRRSPSSEDSMLVKIKLTGSGPCSRYLAHSCNPQPSNQFLTVCSPPLAGSAPNFCHVPQSKNCEARARTARFHVQNPRQSAATSRSMQAARGVDHHGEAHILEAAAAGFKKAPLMNRLDLSESCADQVV